jgi:hypothetical protein
MTRSKNMIVRGNQFNDAQIYRSKLFLNTSAPCCSLLAFYTFNRTFAALCGASPDILFRVMRLIVSAGKVNYRYSQTALLLPT